MTRRTTLPLGVVTLPGIEAWAKRLTEAELEAREANWERHRVVIPDGCTCGRCVRTHNSLTICCAGAQMAFINSELAADGSKRG